MSSILELKESPITETPLLVFDCLLPDGRIERWSTHQVNVEGASYEARVLQHGSFEIQTASDHGVDGIPRISLLLANTDSRLSEIERESGWKGSRLTVAFLFYDLRGGMAATERVVIFQGICNPPEDIREATFRISATNRMNLQRLLLPQVRIQRRCPWTFPRTPEQRQEALQGGAAGCYSRYFRCGYSADLEGGCGLLENGAAFQDCGYTRSACEQRGMFSRFGGVEYIPADISVRTFGDKNWHQSPTTVNQARYNDFVPMVYGTGWFAPPVVFARNDGNLTRMEVLLGMGEMQAVLKVLVNDVEVPLGVNGQDMTGTGWYNVMSLGSRDGNRNPDFADGTGNPAGDPYGSMAYLAVCVPSRLSDGTSLPRVKVLIQGLKLPTYSGDGVAMGDRFSANPAWILLDILRRSGWATGEMDLSTFAIAAAQCDEAIPALDLYGNPITLPRFECNLILQSRRSAGDVVRGLKNAARLMLTYGAGGVLQVRVENAIDIESPTKPAWSNSHESLNGGWPSYEFGDGSSSFSGILRRNTGEPTLRVFSRSMADTPNRYTVEFQDALNEYQHDSFSLVDTDDVARSGQEISAPLSAMGISNFNQAGRILKLHLDKSLRGNTYVEFATSVRAFGIRPGDLISVTYLKEGFQRQLFRVLKLAPGTNHRVTTITAQLHDDSWYADSNGQVGSTPGGRREGRPGVGTPHPLVGSILDEHGDIQFGVEEAITTQSDGSVEANVTVSFVPPAVATGSGPAIPLVSLAAELGSDGSLQAGQILYYAVSASDEAGTESGLSFIVRAMVTADGTSVTLTGLSFGPGTASFSVYRGYTPAQLFRIASSVPPACTFQDTGLATELIAAPDPSYDHANWYWRTELQPEVVTNIHSDTTIGNTELQMAENRYRGMTVRIGRGKGTGQERTISSNTGTTLTVAPRWNLSPDTGSYFTIAESGWKFGAVTKGSPASLTIGNRSGQTIHISGRAANTNDVECPEELSIVTRWQVEGGETRDHAVPPKPYFGLGPLPRGGGAELSGVSFADVENTHSISSGTLTTYYWDELGGQPTERLAAAVGEDSDTLVLNQAGVATAGDLIQVVQEVMRVEGVQMAGMHYRVARGIYSSPAATHELGDAVYVLRKMTTVAPFPAGFFGSAYGGSWAFPVMLANSRLAAAELFVTNDRGNSPVSGISLTGNDDLGLRTFSGGQYSIQVSGCLAVDHTAAPALVIEASRSVREIYAVLGTPGDRDIRLQLNVDGVAYCDLKIRAGLTRSDGLDGAAMGPLRDGSLLTLSVLSVGMTLPGADLTVLIRL